MKKERSNDNWFFYGPMFFGIAFSIILMVKKENSNFLIIGAVCLVFIILYSYLSVPILNQFDEAKLRHITNKLGFRVVYFTEALLNRVKDSNMELNKIQLFIDSEIILQRLVVSKTSHIKGGKIELVNGKLMEIIKLEALMPGIIINHWLGGMNVSFDNDDLSGFKFNVDGELIVEYNSIVNFQNLEFKIVKGINARIIVDSKFLEKFEIKERQLKGHLVG